MTVGLPAGWRSARPLSRRIDRLSVRAYAGGIRVWSHRGQRFYLRGGGWSQSGFRAALLMDLNRQVAVALACNVAHIDPYPLGFDVHDAWLGAP